MSLPPRVLCGLFALSLQGFFFGNTCSVLQFSKAIAYAYPYMPGMQLFAALDITCSGTGNVRFAMLDTGPWVPGACLPLLMISAWMLKGKVPPSRHARFVLVQMN